MRSRHSFQAACAATTEANDDAGPNEAVLNPTAKKKKHNHLVHAKPMPGSDWFPCHRRGFEDLTRKHHQQNAAFGVSPTASASSPSSGDLGDSYRFDFKKGRTSRSSTKLIRLEDICWHCGLQSALALA